MHRLLNKFFSILKEWFIFHQPFILFSIIILSIPVVLSDVPYVNLVYTPERGFFLYLFLVILLKKPKLDALFLIAIFLLPLSIALLLFDFDMLAEQIGNVIFFLLAIGILNVLRQVRKIEND